MAVPEDEEVALFDLGRPGDHFVKVRVHVGDRCCKIFRPNCDVE